jgi:hypothetical protein
MDLPHTAFTTRGVAMLMHIFSKKASPSSAAGSGTETTVNSPSAPETRRSTGTPSQRAPKAAASITAIKSRHAHAGMILHLAAVSVELPLEGYNAQDVANVVNSLAHVFPTQDGLSAPDMDLISRVFDHMAKALPSIKAEDFGPQVAFILLFVCMYLRTV